MQTTPSAAAKLFYYGTNVEVRLGDRIMWRRLFRRDIEGTVVYIPGISPVHPDLEYEGIRQWAVELDDGGILVMLYWPENRKGQPRSNIKFLGRGQPKPLLPERRLH